MLTINEFDNPATGAMRAFLRKVRTACRACASRPPRAPRAAGYQLRALFSDSLTDAAQAAPKFASDHRYICAILDLTVPDLDAGADPADGLPDLYVLCQQEAYDGAVVGNGPPTLSRQLVEALPDYTCTVAGATLQSKVGGLIGEANKSTFWRKKMAVATTVFVRKSTCLPRLLPGGTTTFPHQKARSTKHHCQVTLLLQRTAPAPPFKLAVAGTHLPMTENTLDGHFYAKDDRASMPLKHGAKVAALANSLQHLTRAPDAAHVKVNPVACPRPPPRPRVYAHLLHRYDMLVSKYFTTTVNHPSPAKTAYAFTDMHARWCETQTADLMAPTCEYSHAATDDMFDATPTADVASAMRGEPPSAAVARLFHLSKKKRPYKNTPSYCDRILVHADDDACHILAGDLNFRIFPYQVHPEDLAQFKHRHTQ